MKQLAACLTTIIVSGQRATRPQIKPMSHQLSFTIVGMCPSEEEEESSFCLHSFLRLAVCPNSPSIFALYLCPLGHFHFIFGAKSNTIDCYANVCMCMLLNRKWIV